MQNHKIRLVRILVKFEDQQPPVQDHPFTTALQRRDRRAYEKAARYSKHQAKKKAAKWESFLALRQKIKDEGYHPGDEPIILKWNTRQRQWVCKHGRHRMCLLFDLYGENTRACVRVRNKVAEVYNVDIAK